MRALFPLAAASLLVLCACSAPTPAQPSAGTSSSSAPQFLRVPKAGTEAFNDEEHRFNFMYPAGIFVRKKTTVYPPYWYKGKDLTGVVLSHELPFKFCPEGPTGYCTPTTPNMLVDVVVIDMSIADLKNEAGAEAKDLGFGNGAFGIKNSLDMYQYGYYFPLDATHTLSLVHHGINEQELAGAENMNGFIVFDAQKEIMQVILKSIVL